jgi:Uma2 family endonuclease
MATNRAITIFLPTIFLLPEINYTARARCYNGGDFCINLIFERYNQRGSTMATITAEGTIKAEKSITAEKLAAIMPDASQLLSEEPEMESSLHHEQAVILEKSLERWWRERNDFFIGVNLTIYFSREQLRTRDFRGPDVFIVLGTERRPRTSWVVWEEGGKYPDVIIELLSDSTQDIDREIKKEIYQDRFRTPEYFWFSPYGLEFEGWRLVNGKYEEIASDERGWKWSEVLKLFLGVVEGKLRYFTSDGVLVPTPEEGEQLARQEAEQERLRAEQERLRAERLAERLRALGIDPDSV